MQLGVATAEYSDDGPLNHDTPLPSTPPASSCSRCVPSVCPVGTRGVQSIAHWLFSLPAGAGLNDPRSLAPLPARPAGQPTSEFLCRPALSDRKSIPHGQKVAETVARRRRRRGRPSAVQLNTAVVKPSPPPSRRLATNFHTSRSRPRSTAYTRWRRKIKQMSERGRFFAKMKRSVTLWAASFSRFDEGCLDCKMLKIFINQSSSMVEK